MTEIDELKARAHLLDEAVKALEQIEAQDWFWADTLMLSDNAVVIGRSEDHSKARVLGEHGRNARAALLKLKGADRVKEIAEAQENGKREDEEIGCRCHRCFKFYKVDLLVPDKIWKRLGAQRLLCGACIMDSIEKNDEFAAYRLVSVDDVPAPDLASDLLREAKWLRENLRERFSNLDLSEIAELMEKAAGLLGKTADGWRPIETALAKRCYTMTEPAAPKDGGG